MPWHHLLSVTCVVSSFFFMIGFWLSLCLNLLIWSSTMPNPINEFLEDPNLSNLTREIFHMLYFTSFMSVVVYPWYIAITDNIFLAGHVNYGIAYINNTIFADNPHLAWQVISGVIFIIPHLVLFLLGYRLADLLWKSLIGIWRDMKSNEPTDEVLDSQGPDLPFNWLFCWVTRFGGHTWYEAEAAFTAPHSRIRFVLYNEAYFSEISMITLSVLGVLLVWGKNSGLITIHSVWWAAALWLIWLGAVLALYINLFLSNQTRLTIVEQWRNWIIAHLTVVPLGFMLLGPGQLYFFNLGYPTVLPRLWSYFISQYLAGLPSIDSTVLVLVVYLGVHLSIVIVSCQLTDMVYQSLFGMRAVEPVDAEVLNQPRVLFYYWPCSVPLGLWNNKSYYEAKWNSVLSVFHPTCYMVQIALIAILVMQVPYLWDMVGIGMWDIPAVFNM